MRLEISVDPEDVRAECARRLVALLGARDRAHAELLVAEGQQEATALLAIRLDGSWTEEQAARAAELQAIWERVRALGEASKALRDMTPIPYDYADDRWWP